MDMLDEFSPDTQILLANDEELNSAHWGMKVVRLDNQEVDAVVIYPLSHTVMEENDFSYIGTTILEDATIEPSLLDEKIED